LKLLNNEKVINIMSNTLNHVDGRLVDHGERVAYLIYKILKRQGKYDGAKLRDICLLAMLHDVGAYKTEEIDRMVIFETLDVWEHSIYGSLFLKYFSPLKDLSPVILFHHAECNELSYLEDEELQILSQLISLCDRADVFAIRNTKNKLFLKHIEKYRNVKYRDDIIDMYLAAGINIETIFDEMASDDTFNNIFHKTPLTIKEAIEYIDMIVYTIDFRSSQTVIHTLSTVCIAEVLARKLGLSEDEINTVKTGAVLHDIGKVGIPLHILESNEKISDEDMNIMKTHVNFTGEIIDGNVDDDVKNIAINHHEKLNGNGYPNQLNAQKISQLDRIVAIADIFSALCKERSYKAEFPKDKVIGIISDMAGQHQIDPKIASVAIDNYDEIIETVKKEAAPIIRAYDDMKTEYSQIRKDLIKIGQQNIKTL